MVIYDYTTLLRPYGGKIIDFAFMSLDLMNYAIIPLALVFCWLFLVFVLELEMKKVMQI